MSPSDHSRWPTLSPLPNMPALRLLVAGHGAGTLGGRFPPKSKTITAHATDIFRPSTDSEEFYYDNGGGGDDDDDDDEGPFFDLDFSIPNSVDRSTSTEESDDLESLLDELDFKYIDFKIISKPSPCSDGGELFFFPRSSASLSLGEAKEPSREHRFRLLKLLPRDGRSRSCNSSKYSHISDLIGSPTNSHRKTTTSSSVIKQYFSKVRPFYVKVTKGFNMKRGGITEGRRLRKSRSASSVIAGNRSFLPAPVARRDDSFLEKQDGIERAIAHCKLSFARGVSAN